jgi:hypothetical protein
MWDVQAEDAIRNALLDAEEFGEPTTAYAIAIEAAEILMADAGEAIDEPQAHAAIEAARDRMIAAGRLSVVPGGEAEWRLA